MLTLALRRARTQSGMLAAVVGLIAAAACLVGISTLLLSVTQEHAFHAEVERTQPDDVDVTAYVVGLPGSELEEARATARRVVADVLAPMDPTVTAGAVGPMRQLDGDRVAYLSTDDGLDEHAELATGRWPDDTDTARPEAAVPDVAARLLGLHLGDTVTFGNELGLTGVSSVAKPVTVVVVGTFRPRPGQWWQADPLSGQGYDPAWANGLTSPAAFGPFMIGDTAFLHARSYVTALRVTGHPTLSLAQRSTLAEAAAGLDRASTLLTTDLADRVQTTRVGSDLPATLDRIDAQQASTRSTVLVVVLLGAALAVAAALVAGRLVASRRDDERALLVTLGLSRRQQLAAALAEALVLAAAAAVVAVPSAAFVHSLLTHTSRLQAAGLAQGPTLTFPLVASVVATSLLLALPLVFAALEMATATDRRARHRMVVGTGVGVLYAVAALVCWVQLRAQSAAVNSDVVLTFAPVLGLAAVTLLAVRLVPVMLGAAARVAAHSRGLVVPLAAQQAARRPHASTATVAIAAAVAAGTFGLGLHKTWTQSQDDQAALLVGTDLSLVPSVSAAQQATTIESETQSGALGRTVSPVIDRGLTLGTYVGAGGPSPVVVGVDASLAGTLLRGRLGGGRTWAQVGAGLAPQNSVHGIALPPGGTGIEIIGKAPAQAALQVTVTAVVQDPAGIRSSVGATPVPMDGHAHAASWLDAIGPGDELLGVRLELTGPGAPLRAPVALTLRIPGSSIDAGKPPWQVIPPAKNGDSSLSLAAVTVATDGADTLVRTTATADLAYFTYSSNTILVTGIPVSPDVPVAMSQDLSDAVGAPIGTRLTGILNGTSIPLRVAAVVPNVPSAPGRPAVLADRDLLTRALVDAGELDPGYDAWWIAEPSPAAARDVQRLGLGEVTTRGGVAAQLATGPLRVAAPTALLCLVAIAALMLLLSVGLLLASDRQRRSAEVSRLRALGMSSRDVRRLLLAESSTFLLPLVALGALIGWAGSSVLSPFLVRSDTGGTPIPSAVAAWPWAAELLLLGGSVIGVLSIAMLLTAAHVSQAAPASLQSGEAG